jgi:hypothetical protein
METIEVVMEVMPTDQEASILQETTQTQEL